MDRQKEEGEAYSEQSKAGQDSDGVARHEASLGQESRYWLRAKQDGERFSTMEALLFLLENAGWHERAQRLRFQFEWQVYAGLSVRGDKAKMASFLESSTCREALKAAVERRRAS